MPTFDGVAETVAERVTPAADEQERLSAATATLTERARAALAHHEIDGDVRQVGSTARGTWLAGDRDIDLFVRFPPSIAREQLETVGLKIGHAVLPEGHEEYAEHPYVTGEHKGFDVDLVPCYAVESATDIRSAVDRTPFHTQYLTDRLDDSARTDIRLFKRFLKGIGVYGSDLRTEGFSGYLAELLVLEYGGFEPLLAAVADWDPPLTLDPENHGRTTFDDPLTVIDPTDPERNVAAVLSAANLARLQHHARDLLAEPREAVFFPPEQPTLDGTEIAAELDSRETTPVAIVFDTPDIVDDQLYPQLRKSLAGIEAGLESSGFDVFRSTTFADKERAVCLIELRTATTPAIERHEGPPVAVRDHAEAFFDTYAGDDAVYGPFIANDRYVVERPRAITTAEAYLDSDRLFEEGLGAQIETALEDGYDLRWGESVATLADRFGRELTAYLDPTP